MRAGRAKPVCPKLRPVYDLLVEYDGAPSKLDDRIERAAGEEASSYCSGDGQRELRFGLDYRWLAREAAKRVRRISSVRARIVRHLA